MVEKRAWLYDVAFCMVLALILLGPSKVMAEEKVITPEAWVKVSDDPMVLLEGLSFDRQGNLFTCSVYTGEIFKITPDKKITSVFKDPRVKSCAAIDIHKDGRLFLSTYHGKKIVAIMKEKNMGPKVPEDILSYRRFQARCNDRQLSATVRAEIQVALESSLEQP